MKKFIKQNKYLLLAAIVLLTLVIGVTIFQKSYALGGGTSISKEEVKTSSKSVITTSNDNSYMYFDVQLTDKKEGETYRLNTTIDMTKEWSEISGKTVKAVLEQSTDNENFTQIKEVTLGLNSKKELTSNLDLTENRTYYRVSLLADNTQVNMTDRNADIELDIKTDLEFDYAFKEDVQEFTAPENGDYRIELWGASGNYYGASQKSYAGRGAYTAGTITLSKNDKLYVYTGKNATDGTAWYEATFNGNIANSQGKQTTTFSSATGEKLNHYSATGGGASDVRLVSGNWNDTASLRSRIMVAGGGGGALYAERGLTNFNEFISCSGTGGDAGGLVSFPGSAKVPYEKPGIGIIPSGQTKGGVVGYCYVPDTGYYKDVTSHSWGNVNSITASRTGKFGIGDSGISGVLFSAGGGGYYGGTMGCYVLYTADTTYTYARHTGGSGGSSYISGHTGSIAITSASDETGKCSETIATPVLNQTYTPLTSYRGTTDNSCSIHYSGLKFTDTKMIDGSGYNWTNVRGDKVSMPKPDGGTFAAGNEGSGAARITAKSLGAETILRKGSTVTVTAKYVDEQGNEIAERQSEVKESGDTYTTEQKEIGGYRIKTVPTNKEGTVGNADIEVVYVYEEVPYVITYETDGNGTASKESEEVEKNNNPTGVTNTPNDGYKYVLSKCDKDVTLNNGTTIEKEKPITLEQIKTIKMRENLTCTIYHRTDINENYKCD